MSNRTTTANAASLVVAINPAKLFGLTGYNAKASDQFLQVHDTDSVPANGAVPKVVFKIFASNNFALDYNAIGREFENGITVCNSSTEETLTIGAADCWIDAQVEAVQ